MAIFDQIRLQLREHQCAVNFFLLKMWQKYRVNKCLKPNFALFCEKSTYFSFYLL